MFNVNIFEALNQGDAFSAVALYQGKIDREISVKYQLALFQEGEAIENCNLLYTNVDFGIVSTLLLRVGKRI